MRSIILIILCIFMIPIHAEQSDSSPEMMINIMNHCYEDENKVGGELAQCILEKMRKVDNPNGYQAFINDDNPSKTIASHFSLYIYDKFGDALLCKGIAKEKIVFDKCVTKKIPNFTPGMRMKIDWDF